MEKVLLTLREQFIKDDKAAIPVKISTPEQFYSPYDRNGVIMNDEIADYIDKCVSVIPKKVGITLLFCCPELSGTKKDSIKNLVKIHYGLRYTVLKKDIIKIIYPTLCAFFSGAAFIIASLLLKNELWSSPFMLLGVLSIILTLINFIQKLVAYQERIFLVMRLYKSQVSFKFNQ